MFSARLNLWFFFFCNTEYKTSQSHKIIQQVFQSKILSCRRISDIFQSVGMIPKVSYLSSSASSISPQVSTSSGHMLLGGISSAERMLLYRPFSHLLFTQPFL